MTIAVHVHSYETQNLVLALVYMRLLTFLGNFPQIQSTSKQHSYSFLSLPKPVVEALHLTC